MSKMPTGSGEQKATRGQSTMGAAHHPQEPHQHLPCPRCDSTNTKFCYYNNYNLSQPRHLCKACRRYWTQGGTLRDVPVGRGTRKNSERSRNTPTNISTINSNNDASTTSGSSAVCGGSDANHSATLQFKMPSDTNLSRNEVSFGSFTSLLNSQQGCSSSEYLALGGFGLGLGSGFEEMGYGLGCGISPQQEVVIDGAHGGDVGGCASGAAAAGTPVEWHLAGSGGGEGVFGDEHCAFPWPDPAISMSGGRTFK